MRQRRRMLYRAERLLLPLRAWLAGQELHAAHRASARAILPPRTPHHLCGGRGVRARPLRARASRSTALRL